MIKCFENRCIQCNVFFEGALFKKSLNRCKTFVIFSSVFCKKAADLEHNNFFHKVQKPKVLVIVFTWVVMCSKRTFSRDMQIVSVLGSVLVNLIFNRRATLNFSLKSIVNLLEHSALLLCFGFCYSLYFGYS